MFLVQVFNSVLSVLYCRFQYIICSWFNFSLHLLRIVQEMFQYIICSWFNFALANLASILSVSIHYMFLVQNNAEDTTEAIKEFQYIICSWFNHWAVGIEHPRIVSIHYMFLVQTPYYAGRCIY